MATIDSVLTGGGDGTIQIPDYSTVLGQIQSSLATIATNSTAIKNSLSTIASQQTLIATSQGTIALKQTSLALDVTALKTLANEDGLKMVSPFEWLYGATAIATSDFNTAVSKYETLSKSLPRYFK